MTHVCLNLFDTNRAPLTHLPITRMRNRDQYRMSIRGVSGLALEESKCTSSLEFSELFSLKSIYVKYKMLFCHI